MAENKWRRTRWWWWRTRWWRKSWWRRTNGGEGQMGEKNKWWRRTNGGGAVRNGREQVGEGVRDGGERGERSGGRRKEEREKVFLCVFVSDSSLSVSICLHMSASANINIRHSATRVVYTTGFERLGNPPHQTMCSPFVPGKTLGRKTDNCAHFYPCCRGEKCCNGMFTYKAYYRAYRVYIQSVLPCVWSKLNQHLLHSTSPTAPTD